MKKLKQGNKTRRGMGMGELLLEGWSENGLSDMSCEPKAK